MALQEYCKQFGPETQTQAHEIINKITVIEERSFLDNKTLEVYNEIHKNAKYVMIKKSAFENSSIQKIIIPEGVEELKIEEFAFAKSTISNLELPNSLKNIYIGSLAFLNCKSLEQIILGSDKLEILSIEKNAFQNCSIKFFEFLKVKHFAIKEDTFRGSSIEKIVIRETKNLEINKDAFYDCRKLKQIIFSSNKLESLFIGSCAFENCSMESFEFPVIENLTIKENVFWGL